LWTEDGNQGATPIYFPRPSIVKSSDRINKIHVKKKISTRREMTVISVILSTLEPDSAMRVEVYSTEQLYISKAVQVAPIE